MDHKVGDTVRIQSQEWYDAQKDENGFVHHSNSSMVFNSYMQKRVGKLAKVVSVDFGSYTLDIDNGKSYWQDWMLDSDYRPEVDPLSAEDALRAMLDGETLYDEYDRPYRLNSVEKRIEYVDSDDDSVRVHNVFDWVLHRRPVKRTREMTMQEIAVWVMSVDSLGWLVKYKDGWHFPRSMRFLDSLCEYQRARLLPDHSGVDEDTIQGFEVEI
jgi:hypothetical protein